LGIIFIQSSDTIIKEIAQYLKDTERPSEDENLDSLNPYHVGSLLRNTTASFKTP
jgi:hypothetical protein